MKRLKVVVEGEEGDDDAGASTPATKPPSREQDVLLLLGRDHKTAACLVDWWQRGRQDQRPQQTVSAPVLCFELAGSTCLEALKGNWEGRTEGPVCQLTSDLAARAWRVPTRWASFIEM